MPQRVSLITLGVRDVTAATAFYERLGWRPSSASVAGEVTFLGTPGGVIALWSTDALAADAGVAGAPTPAWRGVALAINLGSRDAVDAAIEAWVAAGGTISRPAAAADWGGYSAYVADPDGNAWELAHNPFWPLDARGLPMLPDADGSKDDR
ncbi:MAG: VOC family protein [Chloroflexi bacterium]|nr:VOC family protein [Chloroflexota bacterium]